MPRFLVPACLSAALLAVACGPAGAFWQRSQVSACSDATTEAERLHLRCWQLGAYADPGWPALGAAGGAYLLSPPPAPPPPYRHKGGVTRRLG